MNVIVLRAPAQGVSRSSSRSQPGVATLPVDSDLSVVGSNPMRDTVLIFFFLISVLEFRNLKMLNQVAKPLV